MLAIRKADKDDARVIWDIRNAAIISQCTGHYSAEELEIWTRGEMTEQFTETVEDSFYVATLDDHVVGTGMINLEAGTVDAIFVRPGQMRTGIGRQLLLHLEKIALHAGLSHLRLDSTLNAAPFYRACGFVGESVAKYESPRGIALDCIRMTKRLCTTERSS
jgi:GNAT superfamily N-acetyltransferase